LILHKKFVYQQQTSKFRLNFIPNFK